VHITYISSSSKAAALLIAGLLLSHRVTRAVPAKYCTQLSLTYDGSVLHSIFKAVLAAAGAQLLIKILPFHRNGFSQTLSERDDGINARKR
jgi:hypothetical protein